MPPIDTGPATRRAGVTTISAATVRVAGWGGGEGATVRLARPNRLEDLGAAFELARSGAVGAIPRGMGRSYGDAAQLAGGVVIETTRLKDFTLDRKRGTVTAGAGATIGELLARLVPAGWMLPVVPGTQHVSIGGAIAGDIHGKNHGTDGTFGAHVEAIGVVSSAGQLLELSPLDDDRVFAATVGGMGLTGVIVWATIRLRQIQSALVSVDSDRVENLDGALCALTEPGGAYRVAWLDLLGPRPGRGIVTRADHLPAEAAASDGASAAVAARAAVPTWWPEGILRPATVRAFNELRYRRAPRRLRDRVEGIGSHMFPLDALDAWPRLYGRHGFLQYQLVVPRGAEAVLWEVIERLRSARVPCYLAVLKDFGPASSAPLSFPIAGWTLALDLPRSAPGLGPLLDRLDEVVAGAGGRVYLSKDARLRPEALTAMYPRLDEWRTARDRADPERLWQSDLGLRTGLVEGATTASRRRPAPPAAARRLLLVGGSSEIGLAIARRLASEGPVRPYLLGRDRHRLASALAELERDGCSGGETALVDADDLTSHERAIAEAFDWAGGFDTVVLAIGVLGAQAGLDADRDQALEVMRVNFAGAGSLLLACLRRLRDQGHGSLVVLSSVAGERPRASNAIYGAAKAGLDALAQGLADATASSGVRVLVVRPGFVRTRMTAGLRSAPMATTPAAVADATVRGLAGNAHTVWVPGRLRLVFAILRHAPRPLFRRLLI